MSNSILFQSFIQLSTDSIISCVFLDHKHDLHSSTTAYAIHPLPIEEGDFLLFMVKEITRYDSLEVLRQQYIKDLETGNWSFNSFAGFADNNITENLPGVPNPVYLSSSDFNLCANACIGDDPGEASAALAASHLVDGNRSTKWEAVQKIRRPGISPIMTHRKRNG